MILCCHGIFAPNGNFISDPRYESTTDPASVATYLDHIKAVAKLLQEGATDILIISGGATKPQIEMSEAESYAKILQYLLPENLRAKVILEESAKDTLENLLFGICRAHQVTGQWPSSVTVISWVWKKERIQLIANALRLPGYSYLGVGDKVNPKTPEEIAAEIADDPLYRLPGLAGKRAERDPWKWPIPYGDIPEFRTIFNVLNEMEKEKNPSLPKGFKFPWE